MKKISALIGPGGTTKSKKLQRALQRIRPFPPQSPFCLLPRERPQASHSGPSCRRSLLVGEEAAKV